MRRSVHGEMQADLGTSPDRAAALALLALGLLCAWRPAEVWPATSAAVAALILVLVPWGWARTSRGALRTGATAAGIVIVGLILSAVDGIDRAHAIVQIALVLAIAATAWLSSRRPPSARTVLYYGLGLSLLALSAVWQVVVGFDEALVRIVELPAYLRPVAAARLEDGRAFASLLLPGHLAVLLATALPLLMARVRRGWLGVLAATGVFLCGLGLLLTSSLLGGALAGTAAAAIGLRLQPKVTRSVLPVLAVVVAIVAVDRLSTERISPLTLRVDNWRTAAWVWSTAPLTGVGLGSYGQASRQVPFPVGNQPEHAHSLPLECLSELGPAGLLALLAGTVWLGALVRRCWSDHPDMAVAIAVIPLHNLADFSLYTSGVALPWAVLVGWAVAAQSGQPAAESSPRGRWVAVTAGVLAFAGALLHTTSVVVQRSAAEVGRPQDRAAIYLQAYRIAPWRPTPVELAAAAVLDGGGSPATTELGVVAKALETSQWLQPESASRAALRSRLGAVGGRPLEAVSSAFAAAEAKPLDPMLRTMFEGLVAQLDEDARAPVP